MMSAVDDGYMLSEKDLPFLVEILTPICHKWEEIAVALKLPPHVRDKCKNYESVIALSNVLNEWIRGNGDKIITLGQLRKIVTGPNVEHSVLANELIPKFNKARREKLVTATGIAKARNQEDRYQAVVETRTSINPVHCERSLPKEDVTETTDHKAKDYKLHGLIILSLTVVPILAILYIAIFKTLSPQDILPPTRPLVIKLQLDSKPRMQNLLSLRCKSEELGIISEVASMCNTFGYLLNLDGPTVKNEWDVPGMHVVSKCQNIMSQWLDGKGTKGKEGKRVTWKTLIEALRRHGKNWLADSLEDCIK